MQDEIVTPSGSENEAAAPVNGAEPAPEPALEASLAQLEAELQAEQARYVELFDRYQRASAEFQNSRRRLEKQMADAIERASTHVVRRLLPVLDDAELAFRNTPAGLSEEQAAWVDGFRAIQKKLLTVQIWLSDRRCFDDMNSVYDQWLHKDSPPARATVESRLATPGHLVEIGGVAAI